MFLSYHIFFYNNQHQIMFLLQKQLFQTPTQWFLYILTTSLKCGFKLSVLRENVMKITQKQRNFLASLSQSKNMYFSIKIQWAKHILFFYFTLEQRHHIPIFIQTILCKFQMVLFVQTQCSFCRHPAAK